MKAVSKKVVAKSAAVAKYVALKDKHKSGCHEMACTSCSGDSCADGGG